MAAASNHPPGRILAAVLAVLLAVPAATALTLADLLNDPNLTPKRFAAYFEDFTYEYGVPVQAPDEFLAARSGDCDDYAVLADYVLSRHHFTTRLIHVRVVGRVAHAVCYIEQNRAYLDYNNRRYFITLTRCGRSIRAIAEKVADSLEANWTSASEFTYDYDQHRKHFGATVVKTDPPETDPDHGNR
ncbi:MAG TPA: transglutaminase-like domain-containing protein [Lacunisphaera sp.]|nr:transglutaminase-like domain-containing protein [Lacunisphaera sp.]